MSTWDAFYGPNAGYVQELYDRYLLDPGSVDPETRTFFQHMGNGTNGVATLAPVPTAAGSNGREAATSAPSPNGRAAPTLTKDVVARVVAAARLARSIREYGHLAADIDPLGGPRPGDPMLNPATHHITDTDLADLPASIVWPAAGPDLANCLEAIERLRDIYSGSIGYDFDHVQNFDERAWLHAVVESGRYRHPVSRDEQRALLRRLTEVEAFERFLHTVFVGQKRFSIEGNDALVPMLDVLIHDATQQGTQEVLIGMSHRGRLNVLAHVLGKPYARIFSQFHSAAANPQAATPGDSPGMQHGWTGDVKYHLGARTTVNADATARVQVTLANNPSHLEFVGPIAEGMTRAAQDDRSRPGVPRQDVDRALPITIHGDAAFPGEGVVAETLNLSGLAGYATGGTIQFIVNNQVGFTTDPDEGRSTLYASDLAKGFEIPIVHVNADDPEACIAAVRLAYAYRQLFHKDFLIDLVGYRRWGHNEGDEPSFTQPLLYARIAAHPTVRQRYADTLVRRGTVTAEEVESIEREVRHRLQAARDDLKEGKVAPEEDIEGEPADITSIDTAVPADRLRAMSEAMLLAPEGFHANPKVQRILARRRDAIERPGGIDWGFAEALAFGSILAGGTPIRLSGQDAERGTFGQRNLVLHDAETGETYSPLQILPEARASFAIYNSPLTEAAVVGFDYGYSVHAPEALVLWEAQYGDFANAAQVVVDQFLSAAQAKWRQTSSLVLLLPHGYEGQGPEHSSARLERYLQLAAEENLRIANCTTAAQYFHLLRLQAALLERMPRPLAIMTPKSLLRLPRAGSSLEELAGGRFHPVLLDAPTEDKTVERLVFCTGRVGIDILAEAEKRGEGLGRTAVGRVELLYPFPEDDARRIVGSFPALRAVLWVQEEPKNMGAWPYIAPRLSAILPEGVCLHYVGRPERAAPAEGSAEAHVLEQGRIVAGALSAAGA